MVLLPLLQNARELEGLVVDAAGIFLEGLLLVVDHKRDGADIVADEANLARRGIASTLRAGNVIGNGNFAIDVNLDIARLPAGHLVTKRELGGSGFGYRLRRGTG